MKRIELDKEEFTKSYLSDGAKATCSRFNCSPPTVWRIAKELGIVYRKSNLLNSTDLSDVQQEIVYGGLLGDSYLLAVKGNCNSSFHTNHGPLQREYCEWKSELLKPFSSDVSCIINPACEVIGRDKGCEDRLSYRFGTCKHQFFTKLEHIWYLRDDCGNYVYKYNSKGKKYRIKTVPLDLKITPIALSIWFFDDGTVAHKYKRIKIATNGFQKDDIELLKCKIFDLGINSSLHKERDSFSLYIKSESFFTLLDMVLDSQSQLSTYPDCLNYKLGK